jgi:hypothetical protein
MQQMQHLKKEIEHYLDTVGVKKLAFSGRKPIDCWAKSLFCDCFQAVNSGK